MEKSRAVMFKHMVRQMEQMYRIDELFASYPGRRFTLEQVASMLDTTIRTVERLYDVMWKFGAPIDTNKGRHKKEGVGTMYRRGTKGWRLDFSFPRITSIMARQRVLGDQARMMTRIREERKKKKSLKSVLTITE